jgi:hypothetical protein
MATEKPDDDGDLFGLNGRPLGGPSDVEIAHAAKTRLKRDMQAALERLRGGHLSAFTEAVWLYWRQHPKQFPYELVAASEALVARAMAEDEARARRAWAIHRTRWEALTELRERRHELFAQFKDDRGTSWERARAAVAEALEKTEAKGSDAAVKRSYEIVEEAGGEDATFEDYKAVLHRRDESDD